MLLRPAIAGLLLASAGPAWAQASPADVRLLPIVDPCARNREEITVCGRRDKDERYRLPIRDQGFDPAGDAMSVSRERHDLYEQGESGIGSCSNVGPGGWTGCFFKGIRQQRQQTAR